MCAFDAYCKKKNTSPFEYVSGLAYLQYFSKSVFGEGAELLSSRERKSLTEFKCYGSPIFVRSTALLQLRTDSQ